MLGVGGAAAIAEEQKLVAVAHGPGRYRHQPREGGGHGRRRGAGDALVVVKHALQELVWRHRRALLTYPATRVDARRWLQPSYRVTPEVAISATG